MNSVCAVADGVEKVDNAVEEADNMAQGVYERMERVDDVIYCAL